MTATTYVDLVAEQYPEQWLCNGCSVVVHDDGTGRWTDGGGSAWCWQGTRRHVGVVYRAPKPVVSPSPLLAWRRDSI